MNMAHRKADVLIVGSGVAGLICALALPPSMNVCLITKEKLADSNSYLAQGGISVLCDPTDRDAYIEDTMKAGHYENSRESVEILVDESPAAIQTLQELGVCFNEADGSLIYTREGGHRCNRILYCDDHTGKNIMEALMSRIREATHVTVLEDCEMTDLIAEEGVCVGICARQHNAPMQIIAGATVLATGGVGGLFENTTNFAHIRGDGARLAIQHGVALKDMDHIQIHPTTFYDAEANRKFLISESVRGEGAVLLNKEEKRFVNELQPRDIVSAAILNEMAQDSRPYQWLDMKTIPIDIRRRFPKIVSHLEDKGVYPESDYVPVVPAQHYTMGGIAVDIKGRTSMPHLYAIGEAACTGVHGANRLASNSLLECVVFGKRTAAAITENPVRPSDAEIFPELCRENASEDALNRLKEAINLA